MNYTLLARHCRIRAAALLLAVTAAGLAGMTVVELAHPHTVGPAAVLVSWLVFLVPAALTAVAWRRDQAAWRRLAEQETRPDEDVPAPAGPFDLSGAGALGVAAGLAEPYVINDACLDVDWVHLIVGHRRDGQTWHRHSLTLHPRHRSHLVEELRGHRADAPAEPLVNDHTIEREFADCQHEPQQCEDLAIGAALIAAVTQSSAGNSVLHIDTVAASGGHAYAADVVLTPSERERLIALVTTGGEVPPARNPLTDPPDGFPAAGLELYDGEDDSSLFTFGHVDVERMVEAVADYVRHTQFAPDAMVKDPLASLIGGVGRVRSTITHGYALWDPRPIGCGDFSAKLLVAPSTPHAWPITYWEGGDALPDLPDVPYVRGYIRGGQDHAVDRAEALTAYRDGRERQAAAACGLQVHLSPRPFDRAHLHPPTCPACARLGRDERTCPRLHMCPECAWTAALANGPEAIEAELDALTPTEQERALLARLIPDPLIARHLCEAIIAAAQAPADALTLDPPQETVQLLVAATRHAPTALVWQPCSEGGHILEHAADERCPAEAACPVCSVRAGDWAGESAGQIIPACCVPAPCSVLTTLAAHFPTSPTSDGSPAAELGVA